MDRSTLGGSEASAPSDPHQHGTDAGRLLAPFDHIQQKLCSAAKPTAFLIPNYPAIV